MVATALARVSEVAINLTAIPRGVTGFWRLGEPPLGQVDEREFRAAVHEVARTVEAVVAAPLSDSLSCNFFRCTIAYSGAERTVVCNRYAPLVALAEPMQSCELGLTFVDDPHVARAFASLSRFEVLSPHDLSRPPADFDLSELGTIELEQIRHWNPQTLGEVVFNWWD
ncbi:hypothetical protein [Nocardia africana]|uniref:Uncharacterized protein n=1 Tax=Nocardia africana TaxID=134964 RepID=A0ABW6NME2_9NOCA